MSVKIEQEGDKLIAYLEGELDHHAAAPIREQIDSEIRRTSPKKVIIDFAQLSFMDSSGIGLVMGRYKLTSEIGASLVVRNISSQIYKVMRLSGIDRIAVIQLANKGRENS